MRAMTKIKTVYPAPASEISIKRFYYIIIVTQSFLDFDASCKPTPMKIPDAKITVFFCSHIDENTPSPDIRNTYTNGSNIASAKPIQ